VSTNHSIESDDLVAKNLRENCVSEGGGRGAEYDRDIVSLEGMWSTMDTCYNRPKKYIAKAPRPVNYFRKCKVSDGATIRDLFSLLRAAIPGARVSSKQSIFLFGLNRNSPKLNLFP
jgi:hypothetical protein